jgi:predicted dehydrogenase/threonine dehydrogenase-like Zn-dependent dehydrogenase
VKQIVQSARTGRLELAEVPAPAVVAGQVLVRNHFSVVSPGTEKMAMDFARKSLLGKARSRPDLVAQVTRKLTQEGPLPTYRAVMNRLDSPQPLGYSCAGVVEAVGDGVSNLSPGDRVACAGAGYANHAEWVCVPENLVVRVPDGLSLDKAAFATLGSISLQGLRVAAPTLGEVAVVVGLGLVGQLAVQLLVANGCRVLGIDIDPVRVKQAVDLGARWGAAPGDDHAAWIAAETGGHGADMALICAASESSAPVQLAADLCRLKGRVVCIGATAMDLDRRTFFEKELDLRMSMSYGPGRYDRRYEEMGLDYPISYVRWTENRNLQAFVELAEAAAVDPTRMDVQTVAFEDAEQTYEELAKGERRSLAVVFRYGTAGVATRSLELAPAPGPARDEVGVAFLGAGNYATGVLLPALRGCSGVSRRTIVTATGPSGRRTAEKFDFSACGTDPAAVFEDENVHLVFVATRHDSHSDIAERALRAGKAVWLEKPAAIDEAQLTRLAAAARETAGFLTVGFNRRFSSHTQAAKNLFDGRRGPLSIQYTVAAGATPGGTWHTDPRAGGGRIIGEGCHFIDFCSHLVGAPPTSATGRFLGRDPENDDSTVAMLGFADGSTATIHYLANASSALPKERWEASADGSTATCDNFRTTRIAGGRSFKTVNQDKGQATAVREIVDAVRAGRPSPISLVDIVAVTRASFAILESARSGGSIPVDAGLPDAAGDA